MHRYSNGSEWQQRTKRRHTSSCRHRHTDHNAVALFLLSMLAFTLSACSSLHTSEPSDSIRQNDKPAISSARLPAPVETETWTPPPVQDKSHVETQPVVTNENDDVWDRLQRGFAFPEISPESIDRQKHRLLAHPDMLAQQIEQALPYLVYVLEQVEQRNLPTELALLPFIESGYKLDAFAYSGAAGLWQLMPGTARGLNIEVNWWEDDRLNPHVATHAALDYLEQLYARYDDWALALSAYNAGPGRVGRALRASGSDENLKFEQINLPRETRDYVPRLYAYRELIEEIRQHHFIREINQDITPLEYVKTDQQIDISVLASLTDLTTEEILAFNPGYRRWATSPYGENEFVLPVQYAQQIADGLQHLDEDAYMPWQQYTIRSGDTLLHIARRFGVTVAELKRVNQLPNSRIITGRTLKVPANSISRQTVDNPEITPKVHVVSSGDSLWKIARKYGLSVQRLASLNKRSPKQPLFPGDEILVSRE